ncbi:hypothetical protein [Bradyrhizobium sp. USDA 372]
MAGQFDNRRRPEFDQCPKRHPFEVQARSCDVLAELSGSNLEASLPESCEELRWDQVDPPQIGKPGSAARDIAVSNEGASVGVAFDSVAFQQHDPVPGRLAEVVPAIGGDRNHPSLHREIVPGRHQAARESERRFWRR